MRRITAPFHVTHSTRAAGRAEPSGRSPSGRLRLASGWSECIYDIKSIYLYTISYILYIVLIIVYKT